MHFSKSSLQAFFNYNNKMADERAAYSRYNVIVAIILTFASLTFGYSNAVISNTVGEPGFLSYFNLVTDPAYGNSIEGAINGVFFAGEFFGAVLVMTICDRIGRKKTATVACILSIIGGALQAGSVKIAMFLVARFITGVGIGTVVIVTPIYQAEISPAKSRGLFVGQHGEWGPL
jgi:MFS family permease